MQQQTLVAGDTLNFLTTTPGYSAADGWVLRYRLTPRASTASAIAIDSTAEGTDHRVQVAPATTAAWAAGTYGWAAWVERAGETYTVDNGQIVVQSDPRTTAAGTDTRTPARRALDAAEEALATHGARAYLQSIEFGDRKQSFANPGEFIRFVDSLRAAVAREEAAEKLRKGLRTTTSLFVRFRRPR